jgi:hypothetical protein
MPLLASTISRRDTDMSGDIGLKIAGVVCIDPAQCCHAAKPGTMNVKLRLRSEANDLQRE